ncbi:MAG: hypothetical protein JKY30_04280 [Flavobacteriales bacterium]|nr:hypothetical protein [Flavobacteriales bacterium]
MTKKFNILFLLAACLIAFNASGQDKILFLNGKTLEGNLLEKTNYEFTFKNKKEKQFIIDKYRVFSYTQNNKESIVYEFDTLSGNFLKVQNMKMFVYGERDAHQTFKPLATNILGFAFGSTAGYLMQKEENFIYIVSPLLITSVTLLFPTKVKQKRLTNTQYLKEDEYLRGYERIARSKRTQGILKSSIAGMGVGFLIGLLVNGSK